MRSRCALLLILIMPAAVHAQARRPTRAARARVAAAPALPPFVWSAVSAGAGYTCGLDGTGQAYCWGENVNRKLGIADSINIRRATKIETPQRFASISTGTWDACALTREGAAVCWGGALTPSLPHSAFGDLRLRQIDYAVDGCGIANDGIAWCWGSNAGGRLGSGRTTPAPANVPERVAGTNRWQQVAVGNAVSCGLTTLGALYCWGTAARLGNAGRADSPVPAVVAGERVFTQVVAGAEHMCAIERGGAAWCWGENTSGALGTDRGPANGAVPMPVAGGLKFKALTAGSGYTCGLTTAGKAYCWGTNTNGVLGNGTPRSSTLPAPVAGTTVFASINGGTGHVCAMTEAGALYCWGDNADGELGVARPQSCRSLPGQPRAVRSCAMAPIRVQDPR